MSEYKVTVGKDWFVNLLILIAGISLVYAGVRDHSYLEAFVGLIISKMVIKLK